MTIDSSLIGKSSTPHTFTVSKEAVRQFMEATEDPALQYNSLVYYVPPTFPTIFRVPIAELEIDTSKMQLLHGEQVYDYTRPLHIGEEVTCIARITDVRQREGRSGSMTILVRELVGTDNEQKPIFTARSTSIVRMK